MEGSVTISVGGGFSVSAGPADGSGVAEGAAVNSAVGLGDGVVSAWTGIAHSRRHSVSAMHNPLFSLLSTGTHSFVFLTAPQSDVKRFSQHR